MPKGENIMQNAQSVPATVKVTLVPVSEPHIKIGANAKAGELSADDFKALKIDTKNSNYLTTAI